jgi:hypothetical protein
MRIKVTNTGSQPVHYVRQFNDSTPRHHTLQPGKSIQGHAITYNADKGQAILIDRDWKAYFDINDPITHTVE